jgi:hypothetical protein
MEVWKRPNEWALKGKYYTTDRIERIKLAAIQ